MIGGRRDCRNDDLVKLREVDSLEEFYRKTGNELCTTDPS